MQKYYYVYLCGYLFQRPLCLYMALHYCLMSFQFNLISFFFSILCWSSLLEMNSVFLKIRAYFNLSFIFEGFSFPGYRILCWQFFFLIYIFCIYHPTASWTLWFPKRNVVLTLLRIPCTCQVASLLLLSRHCLWLLKTFL